MYRRFSGGCVYLAQKVGGEVLVNAEVSPLLLGKARVSGSGDL